MHHKDGNHFNNNLNNLELLCPNCHYFTDSYKGKKNKINKERFCSVCGKEISKWSKSGLCPDCAHNKQRRCEWPDKNTLEMLLKENSISEIGRHYNVSFPTVKKWMRLYNLD